MDATPLESALETNSTKATNHSLRSITEEAATILLELLRQHDYHFVTVTPSTHALINNRGAQPEATDLRGIFGWSRLFTHEVAGPRIMQLMEQAGVLTRHGELWQSLVRVSSLGPHLFLHSAYPTTQADAVFFGPDTYRFVSAINQHLTTNFSTIRRAIDIGCGAGPGALSIATACPSAEVLAIDINNSALRLTAINARAANATNIFPVNSNLFDRAEGNFDLIVANPPYLVDASARTYRHGGGRWGEGIAIDICDAAITRLTPGGTLLLYTGVAVIDGRNPLTEAVAPMLDNFDCDWSCIEMDPDIFAEELATEPYKNAERIAAVVLKVTRHRAPDNQSQFQIRPAE